MSDTKDLEDLIETPDTYTKNKYNKLDSTDPQEIIEEAEPSSKPSALEELNIETEDPQNIQQQTNLSEEEIESIKNSEIFSSITNDSNTNDSNDSKQNDILSNASTPDNEEYSIETKEHSEDFIHTALEDIEIDDPSEFSFNEENSYLINQAEYEEKEVTDISFYEEVDDLGSSGSIDLGSDFDSAPQSDLELISSSGKNVYTQHNLLEFYDEVASGEDVNVGAFDSSNVVFNQFAHDFGEEPAELVSEVLGAWVNWPTNKSTAPLWHVFAEANDNFKVPIELKADGIDAEAFGEALRSFRDFTQEQLEERYGDSVVLYRSVDESGFEQMKTEAPETGSMVLDHRPVESWTIDPQFAENWKDGVVLRKEIDVDDILASQITYPGFIGREKEFLVESSGEEKYSEDEIVRTEDFDRQENAEWALSQLGQLEDEVQRVYGAEWMAIENSIEQTSLQEYGAITVNKSSQFMHVATYENGREAFVTELSSTEYQGEDGADPVEAERAIAGEQFFQNIGLEKYIPEHFVDLDEGYMAVEAVDGYEIDNAPTEVKENVGAEEYLKFAAATILSGNSDMDGRNTMIDDDGNIYGIDIDHAGGDFTEGGRHYRRGINDLKSNADKLGLNISYSDIKEATQVVADQIDPFDATDGIESSQVSNKELYNFHQNIVNNITEFAQGNFPGEFGFSPTQDQAYSQADALRV